jgi:hypothetical protein
MWTLILLICEHWVIVHKFNKTIENTRKQFRSKSNISAPLKQRAKR